MSKKSYLAAISMVVLTAAAPAHAVCLLEPITCTLAGIGIIAGTIKGLTTKNVVHPISVEQDLAVVTQIVRDLRQIKNYTIRMHNYGDYRPGYTSIIERYNKGRIHGNLSLESMMDFSPRLFADLDTLQEVIAKNVGADAVNEAYGPKYLADGSINWNRYKLLATDAQEVYVSLWAVKK